MFSALASEGVSEEAVGDLISLVRLGSFGQGAHAFLKIHLRPF